MKNWAIDLAEHWMQCDDIVHAFGVILYTDSHPHIKKVLTDNDYWAALDEISGPKWPVFSIKPREGKWDLPDMPSGYMGMMIPVWKEPRENRDLIEAFGIESTEGLPILIVFCLVADDQVLHQSIRLRDRTVEEAYSSLKSALSVTTSSINNILPENVQNSEGIYAAISLNVSHHKQWNLVKRGFELFQSLRSLKP